MNTSPQEITLPVDSIIVADRYRKEIGDVSDLAQSITDIGLLNPITVRPWHGGYRLVAGERRLTAFKSLGLTEIPGRVANDIADARDALVAERDENTQRKPMLPSEAAALGMAIEEMEKPAAAERQASTRFGAGPGTRTVEAEIRPRDIAAEAIGMGEATYRRIKTIINVAKDESEPEEVRALAGAAMEAIDAGAPVRSEYDKIAKGRTEPAVRANDKTDFHQDLASRFPTVRLAYENGASDHYSSFDSYQAAARTAGVEWRFTEKQWRVHVDQSRDILDRASLSLEAALSALDRVDFSTITTEQAVEALGRIDRNALNHFIRSLKEISGE